MLGKLKDSLFLIETLLGILCGILFFENSQGSFKIFGFPIVLLAASVLLLVFYADFLLWLKEED